MNNHPPDAGNPHVRWEMGFGRAIGRSTNPWSRKRPVYPKCAVKRSYIEVQVLSKKARSWLMNNHELSVDTSDEKAAIQVRLAGAS